MIWWSRSYSTYIHPLLIINSILFIWFLLSLDQKQKSTCIPGSRCTSPCLLHTPVHVNFRVKQCFLNIHSNHVWILLNHGCWFRWDDCTWRSKILVDFGLLIPSLSLTVVRSWASCTTCRTAKAKLCFTSWKLLQSLSLQHDTWLDFH